MASVEVFDASIVPLCFDKLNIVSSFYRIKCYVPIYIIHLISPLSISPSLPLWTTLILIVGT